MKPARIDAVLSHIGITPVLMDVGASGDSPAIWKDVAARSIYVGFDPDLREMKVEAGSGYLKAVIINEAVAGEGAGKSVEFVLTASPFCSSTLEPDLESVANYIIAPHFDVERRSTVPVTTLSAALDQLNLTAAHWVKIDTQGTDLRVLRGLGEKLDDLLAADVELSLIDLYHGEDLFVDVHREMLRSGFWLADMNVCGAVRIRRENSAMLEKMGFHSSALRSAIRQSPGWCEVRYLRTVSALRNRLSGPGDYGLLWVFAMIDRQTGFALDLAVDYRERFGEDPLFSLMYNGSLDAIRTAPIYRFWPTLGRFRSLLPSGLKGFIKHMLSGSRV